MSYLDAVTGMEEQPNAAFLVSVAKSTDGIFHILLCGVLLQDDIEAEALECGSHIVCITDWIFQTSRCVAAISDNESRPLLGGGSHDDRQREGQKRKAEDEKAFYG